MHSAVGQRQAGGALLHGSELYRGECSRWGRRDSRENGRPSSQNLSTERTAAAPVWDALMVAISS